LHPVAFVVPTPWGDLPFYAYGLSLGVGLVAAWYLARASAKRLNTDGEAMALPVAVAAFGAIIVSWLGRGLLEALGGGGPDGFGFHGGAFSGPFALAGALGAAALLARRMELPVARTLDALAPSVALAYTADALGHYLHGTAFGLLLPEGAPELVRQLGTFPRWVLSGDRLGSPAYLHHLLHFSERMTSEAAASLPVHPVQLYDVALGAFVGAAAFASARPSVRAGTLASLVACALAAGHLVIDRFRFHPPEPQLFGARVTTWLVVLVLGAGALAFIRQARRPATAAEG
jgi:prolipoprotein diacylglyceryltransferase